MVDAKWRWVFDTRRRRRLIHGRYYVKYHTGSIPVLTTKIINFFFYFKYSLYLCGMENNEEKEPIQEIKLTPVLGSSYCQFRVIENKLKIMYENQEKIFISPRNKKQNRPTWSKYITIHIACYPPIINNHDVE